MSSVEGSFDPPPFPASTGVHPVTGTRVRVYTAANISWAALPMTTSAQKKNFMHSKTVKCKPTNYRTQNNRCARDTQTKKIYGSQKELRLQKLHIVQASIQDPNMNLTQ